MNYRMWLKVSMSRNPYIKKHFKIYVKNLNKKEEWHLTLNKVPLLKLVVLKVFQLKDKFQLFLQKPKIDKTLWSKSPKNLLLR